MRKVLVQVLNTGFEQFCVTGGVVLMAAAMFSSPVHAQATRSAFSAGIAWNVQGEWHTPGMPASIHTGDPIWPNALLQPDATASAHSIEVLLPDGQSILYQCFTPADCARGFRVPALFRASERFAVQMLAHIRAALAQERNHAAFRNGETSQLPKDETVAALGRDRRIQLGGLAAKLSNGDYFGDLQSFDSRYPEQPRIALHKSAPSIALTVPGPGLYLLKISDSGNRPRINFMIAVESGADSSLARDFQREHSLLSIWINRDFFGWPVHDFQRFYLESRMLNLQPVVNFRPHNVHHPLSAGITAEPTFSPHPGVVSGKLNITLRCATPGATIHYALGPSQPMESSPIASAPIVMKTLPMTIKAFASAPGKKDSAVVAANFRIDSD